MSDDIARSETSEFVAHASSREAEHSAFRDAVRPLMAPLLAYFVRRVTPQEDAADCLSEVLTVLWRRRKELPDTDERIRQWAYGIAKGVLANSIRGKVRRIALADRVRLDVKDMTVVDAPEIELDVIRALDQLSELDRELVRLIVWDGFGVAEAGSLLGLRAENARSRYSRARTRLKELLA